MVGSQRFFELQKKDQQEALLVAASSLGRPAHLLEKDIWVVWALRALFKSPFEKHLVFKGGTSLSKVHCAIDRFSEDIDVTYDIRQLIPDVVGEMSSGLPRSNAQANKWTKAVRERLPVWVLEAVQPLLQQRIEEDQVSASVRSDGDKLHIEYEPSHEGTGYVQATVLLEFGARSTGEPADLQDVHCDIAPTLGDLEFPTARPRVMRPERTFWEKATAAHVYCHQGTFRGGHRYARHWYDLHCLNFCGIAKDAVKDRDIANQVAAHKQLFLGRRHRLARSLTTTLPSPANFSSCLKTKPYSHLKTTTRI